ncbi:hypothetical protein WA1_18915 [Scytonema hofmannii PCC 7110]|uniref:HTH cro/C1-type domain-containing protein n=1 Tax=Scytonema hofmannii PCC 7110 TaxID=128403 RepID=A0A139XBL4_9CYAN|nr:helix-turn-helix transcriptional regulator [Scytonema hofmannii]KYC42075.1 hypothetical protein WA1_18915 [Scytonema hofmannii PCC 7110]
MTKVVEDMIEEGLEDVPDSGVATTPMNQNIKQQEEIRAVIGGNITRLRQLNCLSQSSLGKLIGLHQQDISQIELGKRKLDIVEAIAISQVLGVELEELFEGVVDGKKSACGGFSLS